MDQRRSTNEYKRERAARRAQRDRASSRPAREDAYRNARPRTSGSIARTEKSVFHVSTMTTVVFLVIFIYILVNVVQYFRSTSISGYVVRTGSLSTDQIYTGIAFREEKIVGSEFPGHVNYFCREGDRLGVGNLAYTIDESSKIIDYLNSEINGSSVLGQNDLNALQNEFTEFSSEFDPHNFSEIYDFKNSMINEVQKMSSSYILADLDSLSAVSSIHKCYTKDSGIMVFSYDSYESRNPATLIRDDFGSKSIEAYSKHQLSNNALVDEGDPVYKIVTDENWSVTILCTQDNASILNEMGYVKVRFLKDQAEIWGKVSVRGGEDADTTYVTLSFTNSMVDYCADRYLKIELLVSEQAGLKVPNSALVHSEFFLVPKGFVTNGPGGNKGVLKHVYTEQGKESTQFIPAVPYSETESDYYLDQSTLNAGDVLVKPDTSETFVLSTDNMGQLTGVYNINRGYADFREVQIKEENGIKYQNEEYSIVEPNTLYGLVEYDRIVLNADEVQPDKLIFQ